MDFPQDEFDEYYERFDSDEDSLTIWEDMKERYGSTYAKLMWRRICQQWDDLHAEKED